MSELVFSGKYLVQSEMARGGMGIVYQAWDRSLERSVAIKQIHAHLSEDPSFCERFIREARAMASLKHENIVTIYEVQEHYRPQFFVMELFGTGNLRTLIQQPHRLPVRDIVGIGEAVSCALANAHARGIVHRDIKPANVLVDKQGKVKLTDFGIAAALDKASITTGQIIGTVEYMSPEQARGVKLDGRSDLWSLGIMLYEMVTGKTPFADTPNTAILGKLALEEQELLFDFPAETPSLFQNVIRDLLRRNPDERVPNAQSLQIQLHDILLTLPEGELSIETDETLIIPLQTPVGTTLQKESTRTVLLDDKTQLGTPHPLVHGMTLQDGHSLKQTTVIPEKPGSSWYRFIPLLAGGSTVAATVFVLVFYFWPSPPRPFPDAELSALLEKFQHSYERCDLDTLLSLSHMSESRTNNVKFMCTNYTGFRATIESLSETQDGATAVLALLSGTRKNGEIIPIDRLSRNNRLQIARHGQDWDKIVW